MKDWTSAAHVGKIAMSIIDILAKEFHKAAKKPDDKKQYDLMIKLSQAVGYHMTIYSTLQKSHEYEYRLQSVEKTIKEVTPADIVMQYNPVLLEESKVESKDEFR